MGGEIYVGREGYFEVSRRGEFGEKLDGNGNGGSEVIGIRTHYKRSDSQVGLGYMIKRQRRIA